MYMYNTYSSHTGDAILTFWRVDSYSDMKVTIAQATKCALNIQSRCGKYKTSVGVILKVKIGKYLKKQLIYVACTCISE